jgi:hypothetical protein
MQRCPTGPKQRWTQSSSRACLPIQRADLLIDAVMSGLIVCGEFMACSSSPAANSTGINQGGSSSGVSENSSVQGDSRYSLIGDS